jgi:hypothetical protein
MEETKSEEVVLARAAKEYLWFTLALLCLTALTAVKLHA